MATSKRSSFNSSQVRYADTKGAGGITVRGFELETDEDGYIEAPPDLAADIAPHGFHQEGTTEERAWAAARGAPAAAPAPAAVEEVVVKKGKR